MKDSEGIIPVYRTRHRSVSGVGSENTRDTLIWKPTERVASVFLLASTEGECIYEPAMVVGGVSAQLEARC